MMIITSGDDLRRFRRSQRLTVPEMAEALGAPYGTYRRWEHHTATDKMVAKARVYVQAYLAKHASDVNVLTDFKGELCKAILERKAKVGDQFDPMHAMHAVMDYADVMNFRIERKTV